MRRTTPRALAAGTLLLLLAGCGTETGGPSSAAKPSAPASVSGSASPSAGHSASGSASPSAGHSASGCAGQARVTAGDSGRTLCVAKGGELRLTLDGSKARPWRPVRTSGPALTPVDAGLVLQPGDANAAYRAAEPGTVRLTSDRPMCARPTAPGQVSCKGLQEFTVTVRVR